MEIKTIEGNLITPYGEIEVIKSIVDFKNLKVLEIGCGIAPHCFELAKNSDEYVAVDINKKKIDYCNQINNSSNIKFICADATNTFGYEDYFDVCVIFHCLHEVPCNQQIQIYNTINKSLKKNGKIIIIDPVVNKNAPLQGIYDLVHENITYYNHLYCATHAKWLLEKLIEEKIYDRIYNCVLVEKFYYKDIQQIVDGIVEDFEYERVLTKEDVIKIDAMIKKHVSKKYGENNLEIIDELYLYILRKNN